MNLTQKIGTGGLFKVEILKKGVVVRTTDFQKNMVLDNFFNKMTAYPSVGSVSSYWYMNLGTGTTPPTGTETALENEIVRKSYNESSAVLTYEDDVAAGVSRFIRTRVYNTVEGDIAGNLSEFGLGGNNANTDLYIRSLFKDPDGNPTVVSLQSDETLRLTHKFIFEMPLEGVVMTGVDIGGDLYQIDIRRHQYAYGMGGNSQYQYWSDLTKHSIYYGQPGCTQAYINGSFTTTDNKWATPSGTSLVSLDSSYERVGQVDGNIMEGHYDVEILASTDTVDNNLLGFGMGHGYYAGAIAYSIYMVWFTPYLKKNPYNKFKFRWTISWGRL